MKDRVIIMFMVLMVMIFVFAMAGITGKSVGNANLSLNGTFNITVQQWIDAQFNQPADTASSIIITDYDQNFNSYNPPYGSGWAIVYLYSNAPNVRLKAEADFGSNTQVVDSNLNYLKLDVYDSHDSEYSPNSSSYQIDIKIVGGTHLTTAGVMTLEAGKYTSQDGKTYYLGISASAKSTMPAGKYDATLNLILMPELP